LKENVQNYPYQDNTAIHGMVFDKNEEYLYSADMWANKVWTHKKVGEILPSLTLCHHLTYP
jgi:carboxy-cis,cis-muconate cyclase